MDEGLKGGIDKIKRLSDSLKRRTAVYTSLGAIDDKGTARALGALQRAPAPGKKIQKVGFILLFSPDPFTTFAGPPLIIAGKYLDRVYNGATIKDIGTHTKDLARHMTGIKDTMG